MRPKRVISPTRWDGSRKTTCHKQNCTPLLLARMKGLGGCSFTAHLRTLLLTLSCAGLLSFFQVQSILLREQNHRESVRPPFSNANNTNPPTPHALLTQGFPDALAAGILADFDVMTGCGYFKCFFPSRSDPHHGMARDQSSSFLLAQESHRHVGLSPRPPSLQLCHQGGARPRLEALFVATTLPHGEIVSHQYSPLGFQIQRNPLFGALCRPGMSLGPQE